MHLYVDSLFVSRANASKEDFQALVNEIEARNAPAHGIGKRVFMVRISRFETESKYIGCHRFYVIAANGKHNIRGIAQRRVTRQFCSSRATRCSGNSGEETGIEIVCSVALSLAVHSSATRRLEEQAASIEVVLSLRKN